MAGQMCGQCTKYYIRHVVFNSFTTVFYCLNSTIKIYIAFLSTQVTVFQCLRLEVYTTSTVFTNHVTSPLYNYSQLNFSKYFNYLPWMICSMHNFRNFQPYSTFNTMKQTMLVIYTIDYSRYTKELRWLSTEFCGIGLINGNEMPPVDQHNRCS